jgi:TonB family protein
MAKKEKFGKFILLEEIDNTGLGTEYRAAKLSSTGLEKIVTVLRLNPKLSANADVAKQLMDQAKIAAQLQNPNIVKIYGIGKVDSSYYISYEFIEGKSLKAIFNRCRHEGFPFSIDHTLLIASKICSALEYAHGRKSETGGRYIHGLLTPSSVFVSYEGEVRVSGFGYWASRIREAGGITEEESLYLSPEQAAGGVGETRSDIFVVGAILFETLTGQPLFHGGRTGDIAARLSAAKLQSPSGDDDSLPKPIADILSRALAPEPGARYAEVQEMRKSIDTLLFSGDFTPTTFNLAFFMHSLFRDDIERESKTLKEEKESTYLEFLTDDAPKPAPPPKPAPTPPIPGPQKAEAVHAPPPREDLHPRIPLSMPPALEEAPGLTAKEAAAGFTFHKEERTASKAPLLAGIAALLLLLGGGGYFLMSRSAAAPAAPVPPTTLSGEAMAAGQRVKELEDKVKAMEEDKAAAEQKAKDDTAAKLLKEAKAKGGEVDAAALQKAQEEAARKARLEQEKKQEEERKKIEEQKRAEEARVAEEARKADEARKAAELAAAAPPPATVPPTTVPAPTIQAGNLVNINDNGVVAPVIEKAPAPQYPPIAFRQRIEGTVELNVLVDEKGGVSEAAVVSSPAGNAGLTEAAVESVKRRKYHPATKDGVPVKVWIPVRVTFILPK